MNAMHRALIRLAAISCVVVGHAVSASAQTTVLVRVDQSTIWKHDFRTPAAVVRAGSILTVVGQRKDWYEVVVPGFDGLKGETGFIFKPFVGDAAEPVRVPARGGPPSAVAKALPEARLEVFDRAGALFRERARLRTLVSAFLAGPTG